MDRRKLMVPFLAAGLLMLVGGTGCEKHQGPAERAGEKIDKGMDKAADKMEDAGDKMKDAADEAHDKVKDAVH